ncbi:hypothetical protein KAR91_57700 [Candidatus Pacearchaeota archaeon]|nr:hypothetical protein [Candidatus Pacearchaeota archaeon]
MKIVRHEKEESKRILFEDLDKGACFWFSDETDENIWMKTNYEQDAVDLTDGEYRNKLCGETVYPVNIELHIFD